MTKQTEDGWRGWNRTHYATPEEAQRSMHERRSLYTEPAAPPEVEATETLKNAPLLTFNDSWGKLIRHLAAHPKDMHELTPRKFEELIAKLFQAEGHQVELTPPTKDGGRDILVCVENNLARHLYLVECKRYAPQHRVAVGLVRSLYGVVESERASLGMLVTTSSFTSGAIDFARSVEHRVSLKDYTAVTEMLKRYHGDRVV